MLANLGGGTLGAVFKILEHGLEGSFLNWLVLFSDMVLMKLFGGQKCLKGFNLSNRLCLLPNFAINTNIFEMNFINKIGNMVHLLVEYE